MAPESKLELRRLQQEAVDALYRCRLRTAAALLERAHQLDEIEAAGERCADIVRAVEQYVHGRHETDHSVTDASAAVCDLRMEAVREKYADAPDEARRLEAL